MLAQSYLSIPATSVPAERVFSTAGNVITKKRNRLSPDTAEMIIFLHENKELLSSNQSVAALYEKGAKIEAKMKKEKEKEKEKEMTENEEEAREEVTQNLDAALARLARIRIEQEESEVLEEGEIRH